MLVTLTPGVDRMRALELLQQAALLITNNYGKPNRGRRPAAQPARPARTRVLRRSQGVPHLLLVTASPRTGSAAAKSTGLGEFSVACRDGMQRPGRTTSYKWRPGKHDEERLVTG